VKGDDLTVSKNPEEIRREIQQTQASLSENVEALAHQKAHLKEGMETAVVEKAAEAKDVVVDEMVKKKEELSSKIAEAKSEVAGKATEVKDKIVGSARAVKEKVMDSEVFSEKDGAAATGEDGTTLKEKARDVASSALGKLPDREGLKRGANRAGAAMADNPAVLALGSLAAGLLVGLATPLTRAEREKVTPMASQARVKAIATGTRAAAEQVSEKVDRGVDVVTQRVSEKIDTLAGSIKGVADKVGFGDVVQNVGERAKEGVTTLAGEVADRAKGIAADVAEKGKAKETAAAAKEPPAETADTETYPLPTPPGGRRYFPE
jgi:hypothetical protein